MSGFRLGRWLVVLGAVTTGEVAAQQAADSIVVLPAAVRDGGPSVARALAERRSVRALGDAPLSLEQLGQLLWAAQGVNRPDQRRTAPSAGATYPIEVFVVVGAVPEVSAGVYRYRPREHDLVRIASGDRRGALVDVALRQQWMTPAPAIVVVAAEFARTMQRYGERGVRYVHIEVGAVAENVYLQAGALGLGTTFVGSFDDAAVKRVLELPSSMEPLALLPIGHPAR